MTPLLPKKQKHQHEAEAKAKKHCHAIKAVPGLGGSPTAAGVMGQPASGRSFPPQHLSTGHSQAEFTQTLVKEEEESQGEGTQVAHQS